MQKWTISLEMTRTWKRPSHQRTSTPMILHRHHYASHITSRIAASPSASAPDSDRLPSAERERRQALEYEEEEIPPDFAIEVKEAEVAFPNLPVPKSSDGDVRKDHLNRWRFSDLTPTTYFLRIGLCDCPISSKSTLSLSTLTPT